MARNQKLTTEIGGRIVQRATAEPGKLVIRFDDQSTMQVKTARTADIFPPGGKIKAIQEDGPEFNLQFEDGSTAGAGAGSGLGAGAGAVRGASPSPGGGGGLGGIFLVNMEPRKAPKIPTTASRDKFR